jgi:hypothetical protein
MGSSPCGPPHLCVSFRVRGVGVRGKWAPHPAARLTFHQGGRMPRAYCLLLCLLLCAESRVAAQEVQPGSRIRVHTAGTTAPLVGTLADIGGDTLQLLVVAEPLPRAIPKAAITRLEISQGQQLGRAALWGVRDWVGDWSGPGSPAQIKLGGDGGQPRVRQIPASWGWPRRGHRRPARPRVRLRGDGFATPVRRARRHAPALPDDKSLRVDVLGDGIQTRDVAARGVVAQDEP